MSQCKVIKSSSWNYIVTVAVYEGEHLNLTRISRTEMGVYLCIATNGVPPSVSKRVVVDVECKCISAALHLCLLLYMFCNRLGLRKGECRYLNNLSARIYLKYHKNEYCFWELHYILFNISFDQKKYILMCLHISPYEILLKFHKRAYNKGSCVRHM